MRTVVVCGLNLDANPHPPGIYVQALEKASNIAVHARSDTYCKITKPRKIRNESIYASHLLTWSEIDKDAPWLDTLRNEELTPHELNKIFIPDNAKPNFKAFEFIFTEKKS